MVQQHLRQFLEWLQSLPPELIDPTLQVVQHRTLVVVGSQPVQTLLEDIGFEPLPVERKQLVKSLAPADRQVHPSAQQQPAFAFTRPRILVGHNVGRRATKEPAVTD